MSIWNCHAILSRYPGYDKHIAFTFKILVAKDEIMSIEIYNWNMTHTRLNDKIFKDNVVVVVILVAVTINDDDDVLL